METITLETRDDCKCWLGITDDPATIEIMGQNAIPLPYPKDTPASYVIEEVLANPYNAGKTILYKGIKQC